MKFLGCDGRATATERTPVALLDRVRPEPSTTDEPATAKNLPRGAGRGVLLALVATVVWSGSFVTSRALHDSAPPVQAAFWRWIVALLAVAPFAARETWRQRRLVRPPPRLRHPRRPARCDRLQHPDQPGRDSPSPRAAWA
ncbi:EamA family transporter [Streptomyces lateritius]|uniref:EamA family transporter n=1 Tax=Streptomyces lateritius TaxID=67313 RepID=A0ABW6YHK9_9ACTN